MMKERYRNMMEQISLDEDARARIAEGLRGEKKRRGRVPLRPILAAACVCGVLVGGALAAEMIFSIPVFRSVTVDPFTGEEFNGFSAVQSEGEQGEVVGVVKQPESIFSEQVLAAAAEGQRELMEFGSWEAAEEYLGVELMDSDVLAGGWYYPDGEYGKARLTVSNIDGKLTAVRTSAAYLLNAKEVDGRNVAHVRVGVDAALYTEHSSICEEEMHIIYGFPEEYTFTSETYTAPNGLTALIVEVTDPESGTIRYIAQFEWRGAAFAVNAVFNPDPDHALETLKQVLGSFA